MAVILDVTTLVFSVSVLTANQKYQKISGSYEVRMLCKVTVTSSRSIAKDAKCIQDGSYVPDHTDMLWITAAQDT